ncbi:MAG: ATPase [Desulfobacterales bacterium]|jgi:F-type H+-transporting ATPase subunit b|nr:ATPase [Desulfobacterales bacterium]
MIKVDGSLFIQIVNFLFLIWIMNVVLYKPIRNVLIRRKEKMGGLEQNIVSAVNDAKEKEESFANGIKEARSRGMKKKDALIQEATQEEKRIVEEINKKAQANMTEIREKISKEAEGVQASLQKEIDSFAQAIGEKILGRAIS